MKKLSIILSVFGLVFFSFVSIHVMAAEKVVEQEDGYDRHARSRNCKNSGQFYHFV